jgi:hypothetical protein
MRDSGAADVWVVASRRPLHVRMHPQLRHDDAMIDVVTAPN